MFIIDDYINTHYQFLFEQNFLLDKKIEGDCYSSVLLMNSELKLLFRFIFEKEILSVSITSSKILYDDKYNKFNKFYDFFYVSKLLNPNLNFSDINSLLYPTIIKTYWDDICVFFNEEKVDESIKKLKVIEREYNKKRWEKYKK